MKIKKLILLLLIGLNVFGQITSFNRGVQQPNISDEYTPNAWTQNAFDFDNTNNIFTGDATISTTLNNAIVGSNKQFTLSMWVRRKTPLATTQILFGRDKSSATSARQIVMFLNSSNQLIITLYTNSSNSIQYISTGSFTDSRIWNNIVLVYDGTASPVTTRITVYVNGIAFAGTTTQTGTFTTINNISSPNVNIGGRSDATNYSSSKINQISLYNTNLSASNVAAIYNKRVVFDERTNSTLNANLVMLLNADYSTSFSTNWTWTDLVGGGVFTSSGMVSGDLVADAPALKQIPLIVLWGQSNAVGRVDLINLEYQYIGSLNWCKIWDNATNSMVNINSTTNNNQLNDPSNQYGIEYYLTSKLNKYYKKTYYVFKYAVGGTALTPLETPSWCVPTPGVQPSGGTMWQAVYNTEMPDLLDWELNNGYTITSVKVIWLQGERDSQVLGESITYETNWTNFLASAINGLLKSYFYVTPYVYDCLLSNNQIASAYLYKSNINTAKTNVQATNPTYYRTINTNSATVNQVDSAHYDKAGIKTISDSLFNKMKLDGL